MMKARKCPSWLGLMVMLSAASAPPPPPPLNPAPPAANAPPPQQSATEPQQEQHEQLDLSQLPWPVKLGARSMMVSQAFPLIDRVTLVPDAATYLDELGRWSPQGRWPVLIEDRVLAPMFVRRFKPAQLIRRESIVKEEAGAKFPIDPKQLDAIIIRTFGGDPETQSVREAFAARQYVPPGVVIASMQDGAWTGAIALAAGRGQPIAWLNESFGTPNDELDHETTQRLMAAVDGLIARQGYPYEALGDEIDAITICRDLAGKCRVRLLSTARPEVGGPHAEGPIAVTDLLGRHADGARYAFAGWIFGDEIRAAYMAMCSLFLPRERIVFCNTYPADAAWTAYGMGEAAEMMRRAGYSVRHDAGAAADVHAWRRGLSGGWSTDVVVMNTKGNNNFFDMFSGQAYPPDVPLLNEPAALHLTHSWSMQYPDRGDTVGGQWLRHGAYAAVGSCHEPYLAAFVPPAELARRWTSYVPFLIAARWWEQQQPPHPLSKPWRVITIGDPLMLCGPAPSALNQPSPARVNRSAEYGVDLVEQVKELLRKADADQTNASAHFAQAIVILNMLGKDDVAIGVWRLASAGGDASACARPALDVLFRRRDFDEFLRAWDQLPSRDEQAIDMLWHLFTPRLSIGNPMFDQDMLLQLQSAIRQPFPQHDLERLANPLSRVFGKPHVQEVIQREMKKAVKPEAKSALAELLKQY